MRLFRKFKRKTLYKKGLILFTLLLLLVCGIFLGYVYNSMVIYERNLVDNYIKYLAESNKLTEYIDDNLFEISKYEKKNTPKISDGIKEIFKSDNLVIKKNNELSKDDIFAYDLKINDNLISTVSLKKTSSYKRMAILKIDEWEVVDVDTYFNDGIYNYELDDSDIIAEGDIEGLERLTKYIEINKTKTYKVNNLVYEPDIKILDKYGKEQKYEIKNNKIALKSNFKELSTLDEAKTHIKEDFDILSLAKNWSLFLTDDLNGAFHGFYILTPYLIKDSYMYEMAYGWSHNVDITFVSSHRLKNPTFTNEKIENFVIYNDNAFSCEVYIEKNMIVNGKDKVDVMHDRLYFIYYEDGYKLVDMESIE